MVDVATQQLCQQHLPVPSPFTSQDAQTMLWDDALLAGSHEALLNGLPELTDAEWCEAAGVWCDGALLAPPPQCSLPPLQHQASPDTPLAWDAAQFLLPPPSHCCDAAAAPKPAPFLFGMPQQAALEQQYEQPLTPPQALQPLATLSCPLLSPPQQLDCSPHAYGYNAACFADDAGYSATLVADAASPTAAACTPSACCATPFAAASPPAAADADLSSGCCDSPTASADADASSGTPFATPLGRRHSCGSGASPVMTGGWSCPPEESPRCADIAAVLAADASVGASCTSGTPVGGKYVGVSASRTKGRF